MEDSLIKKFKIFSLRYCLILVISVFVLSIFINVGVHEYIFSLFISFLFLAFSFSFYAKYKNVNYNRYIIKLIFITLIIKIISVFVFTYILNYFNGYPFLSLKDDFNYYNSAVAISRNWRMFGFSVIEDIQFSTGFYSGYPNLNALFIYYFGESVYVLRFANVFFSSFIVLFSAKILKTFASDKSLKLVLALISFSPTLIFFSSFILKDIILLLLTLIIIYVLIEVLCGRFRIHSLFLLLGSLVGVIFFRAATLVPLFLSFIIVYLLNFLRVKKSIFSRKSFIYILLIGICFISIWSYLSSLNLIDDINTYFVSRNNTLSNRGISDISRRVNSLSFLSLLGTPVFLICSIFLPSFMFIVIGNEETINYSAAASIYNMTLLPFMVFTLFYCLRRFRSLSLPVMFLVTAFIIFKLGLVSSINSLFSLRQSLGAVFIFYFLLAVFFDKFSYLPKVRKYVIISIVILLLFNFLRLYIRL